MRKKLFISILLLLGAFTASASDICDIARGAKVIAQDGENTYLGEVSNYYSSDSIFNEYGTYGNEYSETSVFNSSGSFGSSFDQYSARNPQSSEPPMLIKDQNFVGYLSSNKNVKSAIAPDLLKSLCGDSF